MNTEIEIKINSVSIFIDEEEVCSLDMINEEIFFEVDNLSIKDLKELYPFILETFDKYKNKEEK